MKQNYKIIEVSYNNGSKRFFPKQRFFCFWLGFACEPYWDGGYDSLRDAEKFLSERVGMTMKSKKEVPWNCN